MEKEKFIIYVGENHGESEKTGEPYHVYKFFELFERKGVIRYKQVDLFAKKRIDGTSAISFGSRVMLTFKDSDEIGGRPLLVGVDVVTDCPFKDVPEVGA